MSVLYDYDYHRAKIALERPVSADDIPLVGPNVYHPHLEERFSSGGGGMGLDSQKKLWIKKI